MDELARTLATRLRGAPPTLHALASTLGVPLAGLLESGPPPPDIAVLLPARQRPRTTTPGGSLERLATGLPAQRIRGLGLVQDSSLPPLRTVTSSFDIFFPYEEKENEDGDVVRTFPTDSLDVEAEVT